ncbi:MAG: lycopene cyclase domain-containing protein [Spirochaetota bacterium]
MTLYVGITLLVLVGPFVLSFDRKVAFYTHWRALVWAIVPVSSAYILWDVIVTERGHWSFSDQYSGTVTILGLPLGEWLFFITVPYACMFIYEVVKAYFPRKTAEWNAGRVRTVAAAVAVLLVAIALMFRRNEYTVLALVSVALWLVTAAWWKPWLLREIHTLWFFLLCLVAFLLINGILTGLPIVSYNPEVIWGLRVITIPLEDVFYNISLLGFYLVVYTHANHEKRRGSS